MQLLEVKKEINKIKRTQFGASIPELKKFAKHIAKITIKNLLTIMIIQYLTLNFCIPL